jgi:hypothetical protein
VVLFFMPMDRVTTRITVMMETGSTRR